MSIGIYTKPLFEKITSEEKWYAGILVGYKSDGTPKYMQPNHAWNIIERFKKGTLKESTLIKLMSHFGYEIHEVIWKKK